MLALQKKKEKKRNILTVAPWALAAALPSPLENRTALRLAAYFRRIVIRWEYYSETISHCSNLGGYYPSEEFMR